jgi:hypothetical protein
VAAFGPWTSSLSARHSTRRSACWPRSWALAS